MSWWDYGYQITAMGNRTVIVDNNTWNNTHIATVGMAMASEEPEAYEIIRSLDVDYVLVVFGGMTGYASDDINKSESCYPSLKLPCLLLAAWGVAPVEGTLVNQRLDSQQGHGQRKGVLLCYGGSASVLYSGFQDCAPHLSSALYP